MKSPWWFCCGWWSPWCVIDTVAHELFKLPLDDDGFWSWICDKHDDAIRNAIRKSCE